MSKDSERKDCFGEFNKLKKLAFELSALSSHESIDKKAELLKELEKFYQVFLSSNKYVSPFYCDFYHNWRVLLKLCD